MALTSFSGGINTSFSSQLNNNFIADGKILAVYTGTAFNASANNATATNAYEFADITAASLGSADYLVIRMTVNSAGNSINAANLTSIKIETKSLAGAYADSLATTNITQFGAASNRTVTTADVRTVEWVHTLTANEKSQGVKVKITGSATSGNSGDVYAIANIQTVIRAGA